MGPRPRRASQPTSGRWRSTVIYHPTCTQLYTGPRKRTGCVEPTLSEALGAQSLWSVAQIQGAPVLLGGRYKASKLKPEYSGPKSVKSETKGDDDGCQPPCSQVVCGPGGNPRKKPGTLEPPESRPSRRALVGRAYVLPRCRRPQTLASRRTQRKRKSATKSRPAPAPRAAGWGQGPHTHRAPGSSGAGPGRGCARASGRDVAGRARRAEVCAVAWGVGQVCEPEAGTVPTSGRCSHPGLGASVEGCGVPSASGRNGCWTCWERDGGRGNGRRVTAGCGACGLLIPGSGLDLQDSGGAF